MNCVHAIAKYELLLPYGFEYQKRKNGHTSKQQKQNVKKSLVKQKNILLTHKVYTKN